MNPGGVRLEPRVDRIERVVHGRMKDREVREWAIGLVPCEGVNASVATVFQSITALPRGRSRAF